MSALTNISVNPDLLTRRAVGVLRFVDAVSGLSIIDGLSVIARIRNQEIPATPAQNGVHIFHQLPGLSRVSFWDGDTQPQPEPQYFEYKIEVRDSSRRFFSTTFKTNFTAWPEAIPICPEVVTLGQRVPLFSVPWRLQRNDYAIIRGVLWRISNDQPASWALIRVYREDDDITTAKPVMEGVAGADGEFMLMFPWPKADPSALNGPQGPRWTVRLLVWFDAPDAQIPADELPDGEKRLPALCSILRQQPATVLEKVGPDVELTPQEMTPDQTLYLKTFGKKVLYLK